MPEQPSSLPKSLVRMIKALIWQAESCHYIPIASSLRLAGITPVAIAIVLSIATAHYFLRLVMGYKYLRYLD